MLNRYYQVPPSLLNIMAYYLLKLRGSVSSGTGSSGGGGSNVSNQDIQQILTVVRDTNQIVKSEANYE